MTAAATEPKTTSKTGTAYIVLRKRDMEEQQDGKPVYSLVGGFTATSPKGAIRQHVEAAPTTNSGAGTYVAIPARSFVEKTVKVETQTVVKLA